MKKLLVVSGLVLVVIIAAISETSAQTIYSCYNKKSGAMRYVTGPNMCKKSETQISWTSNPTPGFDVSRLYTISQQYNIATCLNDDVSISCSAKCLTDPNGTGYGFLEEVVNYEFGQDPATGEGYAYDDHKPGSCEARCNAPFEPTSLNYIASYTANIKVLCLPRD